MLSTAAGEVVPLTSDGDDWYLKMEDAADEFGFGRSNPSPSPNSNPKKKEKKKREEKHDKEKHDKNKRIGPREEGEGISACLRRVALRHQWSGPRTH